MNTDTPITKQSPLCEMMSHRVCWCLAIYAGVCWSQTLSSSHWKHFPLGVVVSGNAWWCLVISGDVWRRLLILDSIQKQFPLDVVMSGRVWWCLLMSGNICWCQKHFPLGVVVSGNLARCLLHTNRILCNTLTCLDVSLDSLGVFVKQVIFCKTGNSLLADNVSNICSQSCQRPVKFMQMHFLFFIFCV